MPEMTRDQRIEQVASMIDPGKSGWAWKERTFLCCDCPTRKNGICKDYPACPRNRVPAPLDTPEYTLRLIDGAEKLDILDPVSRLNIHAVIIDGDPDYDVDTKAERIFAIIRTAATGEGK